MDIGEWKRHCVTLSCWKVWGVNNLGIVVWRPFEEVYRGWITAYMDMEGVRVGIMENGF